MFGVNDRDIIIMLDVNIRNSSMATHYIEV
jgi:hypothetical protein